MAKGLSGLSPRDDNANPILHEDCNECNFVSLKGGFKDYNAFQGRLTCCRNILESDDSSNGSGVQYECKSLTTREKDICELRYACDMCGENITSCEIQATEDCIYLCSDCFKHLDSLHHGEVKKSIVKFLIGNVL